MFQSRDDTGGSPSGGDTKRYHGVARRGHVVSRSPLNPETEPPEKVAAGKEPTIRVQPNGTERTVEVVVPQRYAQSTGTPRVNSVVYFMTTNTDRSILLGVAGQDHDNYIDERKIPHQHKDNDITFTETGTIRVSSRNEPPQGPRDDVDPEDHTVKLETVDTEVSPIEVSTLTLDTDLIADVDDGSKMVLDEFVSAETKDFDATPVPKSKLSMDADLTVTLADGSELVLDDVAKLTTNNGDTIEFDDTGSLVINGGTTPVVTDVSANVNQFKDTDGHLIGVTVNLDVTENESVMVDSGQEI